MVRFCRLVLAIVLALVGVLVLTRLLSNGPTSSIAALFTNPDGSVCQGFCLFGVQPGKTSPQAAVALLKAHPLTYNLRQAQFAFVELGPAHTTVTLTTTLDSKVDSINVNKNAMPQPGEVFPSQVLPESSSLGDIVSLVGNPSFIMAAHDGVRLYSTDSKAVIIVYTAPFDTGANLDIHLDPRVPVMGIALYQRPPCLANIAFQLYQPWMGFTSYRQYKKATTFQVRMVGAPIPLPCQS